MRSATIDERNLSPPAPAEPVAEPRRQLESRRAAADDDDPVQIVFAPPLGHWRDCCRRVRIRARLERALPGRTSANSLHSG
jgi:hypothetical protein